MINCFCVALNCVELRLSIIKRGSIALDVLRVKTELRRVLFQCYYSLCSRCFAMSVASGCVLLVVL